MQCCLRVTRLWASNIDFCPCPSHTGVFRFSESFNDFYVLQMMRHSNSMLKKIFLKLYQNLYKKSFVLFCTDW